MSEWEPATDAERAMRDALRTDDQESYFRILAGVDLLLPVSADALAGLAPLGWGTWSTGGRTHVLAFTSPSALQACLADYTGSARRVAYGELADTWPNLEWWLAVNPGLPIEGYLPAWFVAQLSRGDLRLPTRGAVRDASTATQDPQAMQAAALAANAAAAGDVGGPLPPGGATGQPGYASAASAPTGGHPGAPAGQSASHPESRAGQSAGHPGGGQGTVYPGSGAGHGAGNPGASDPGASGSPPGGALPGGPARGGPSQGRVGPGGLPIRTPGAVLPSGLPSRLPANPDAAGDPGPAAAGPAADQPPTLPAEGGPGPGAPIGGVPVSAPPQGPRRRLPTRTPMAQTPPLPDHVPPPDAEQPASRPVTEEVAAGTTGRDIAATASGGVPPRRQPASSADRPGSMAVAAQALAGGRAPESQTSAPPSGPPVIPGAPGSDRPGRNPFAAAAAATRPAMPTPGAPTSAARGTATSTGTSLDTSTDTPFGTPAGPSTEPATGTTTGTPASAGASMSSTPSAVPTSAPPDAQATGTTGTTSAAGTTSGAEPDTDFEPTNAVERDLLTAADGGSTDAFLSTLLLATVLVPVADSSRPGSAPGESGFAFRTEEVDGERFLVVFTSRDRLAEHYSAPARTVGVKFLELIRNWPDPTWSFAVNPGTPVGAKYPGPHVIALANWAAETGLDTDQEEREEKPAPLPHRVSDSAQYATVMQKTVPAEQVDYYLERGYDRVGGFVHRAHEVEHLRTPAELFAALGLVHGGSSYTADAKEAFVLRWPAYRPSLYRIPYGGQSEQALRAMDGWVIERPPFRGNGFAPGEGRDVIAEFKVDSVRLPHGAQLWRMDGDGNERMIAIFDSDAPVWRRVGEQ